MATYNVHAGHCPYGNGACGAVGILNESVENRIVKNKVIADLKTLGNTVYDCTDDSNCSDRQNLYNIAAKCNNHKVDADISIHLNAGGGTGVEVWVTGNHQSMTDMADRICRQISGALGIKNRGVKRTSNLYILNHTDSPALLIECCFVDSQTDASHWNAVKCAGAITTAMTGKSIPAAQTKPKPTQSPGKTVNNEGLWYRAHVADVGTLDAVHDGQTAGTTGYAKAIQGLWIDTRLLMQKYKAVKLNAKAHIQGAGWVSYKDVQHDTLIGTTGQNKRLEAIELDLQGLPAGKKLLYRTHLSGTGWTVWIEGGYSSGSVGLEKGIEAIQLKIV